MLPTGYCRSSIHDLESGDIKCMNNCWVESFSGVEFIYKKSGVDRPLTTKDSEEKNLNKTNYRNQINKVALAIREIITSLTQRIVEPEEVGKELNKPVAILKKNRKTPIIIGSLIALALVVLGIIFIPKLFRSREQIEKSIAILPFINDSPDEENAYFINGIMDEILINLQRIEDLRVISRNSVEQYRGTVKPSTPAIAKKLGVNYIVEGSGQKYGNTIRLRIQLIEANTDRHLWAESYEQEMREIKDIFSIQSQIARSIATELKAIITPEENQLIAGKPTANLTAYDLFQRGREEHTKYWNDNNNLEALGKAEDYYHQALEYEPEYALVYIGLAKIYWDKHFLSEYFSENFMDSVLILTDIALSYDNKADEGYILKGKYYIAKGNREKALGEFDKALKINPNSWEAYWGKGNVYWNDDPVRILENYIKAASLNRGPELPGLLRGIAMGYYHAGFIEMAKKYVLEAFELDGDSTRYFNQLGYAEFILGNYEKSIKLFEKIMNKITGQFI